MLKQLAIILSLSLAACKTPALKQAKGNGAPSSNPGSCRITGKIVSVDNKLDADTGSICSKYPCKAMVQIIDVTNCGSSVTIGHNPGDTIEMRFVYSLHNTKKLFPEMKVQYPGLRRGQTFITDAVQRLVPGSDGVFVVFAYDVK